VTEVWFAAERRPSSRLDLAQWLLSDSADFVPISGEMCGVVRPKKRRKGYYPLRPPSESRACPNLWEQSDYFASFGTRRQRQHTENKRRATWRTFELARICRIINELQIAKGSRQDVPFGPAIGPLPFDPVPFGPLSAQGSRQAVPFDPGEANLMIVK